MADHREEIARDRGASPPRGDDLADEVERAQTPRTPVRAFGGVWLTIATAFALILALVVVVRYFS